MGMITFSDSARIIEKMLAFHALGVLPTSAAIVPTLSFTSVNIVSRFDMIQPCSISFMNSVILSMIPNMAYENRVERSGITVCAIMIIPPPLISCFIPNLMEKLRFDLSAVFRYRL